jgi:hypothetical protein
MKWAFTTASIGIQLKLDSFCIAPTNNGCDWRGLRDKKTIEDAPPPFEPVVFKAGSYAPGSPSQQS